MNTFGPPVYMGTALCAPTELTEIQSFQLTCSQDFGENSRLPPTKLSNILECNVQDQKQQQQKKLFVGSQVLALQIIHDHESYWFALVFLRLITHC